MKTEELDPKVIQRLESSILDLCDHLHANGVPFEDTFYMITQTARRMKSEIHRCRLIDQIKGRIDDTPSDVLERVLSVLDEFTTAGEKNDPRVGDPVLITGGSDADGNSRHKGKKGWLVEINFHDALSHEVRFDHNPVNNVYFRPNQIEMIEVGIR